MTAAVQNNRNGNLSIALLKQFIKNERLMHANFYQLDELLAITAYEYRKGSVSRKDIVDVNASFGREFLEKTLHGRGFLKPNGYPGDYLFLDRIYTNHISANPKYGIWDEYVQQNGAPNAVSYTHLTLPTIYSV